MRWTALRLSRLFHRLYLDLRLYRYLQLFYLIVDQMCPKSGGDAIDAPLLSIGCRLSSKWLNIVLDLNGVLYQCVERSSASRHEQTFRED